MDNIIPVLAIVITAVIIALVVILAIFTNNDGKSNRTGQYGWSRIFVSEKKRAGIQGEIYAFRVIENLMQEGDTFASNVEINVHEQKTEIDALVINKYGVRIIEVKNWVGELYGDEDDYNWEKAKVDNWGNVFYKEQKNPIKQVKREIYLLKEYLKERDINVWIDGYVYFINENCPIESDYVLESIEEIDGTIHSSNRKYLTKNTIDKIIEALEDDIVL